MNDQTTKNQAAQGVGSGALFGRFEIRALYSAHNIEAEKLEKYAAGRRKWAEERGPIWQKYLAAAIKLEGLARRHRDRACELLQPNTKVSHDDSADFQLVSEAGPAPEQPLAAVGVGSGALLGDWEPRRAPECDTAAREASIDGLLTFILMRHGAWSSASADNPHREIYLEARNNAIRELKWRILQNWHEADLHCRTWQRLGETLDAIRAVMEARAGYEKPTKGPEWPFAAPNAGDVPRPLGIDSRKET